MGGLRLSGRIKWAVHFVIFLGVFAGGRVGRFRFVYPLSGLDLFK